MQYEINDLNDQGKGICYVDNKITFVNNVVIGDIVEIDIIKKFSKYNIANVKEYIKYSDKRVDSYCKYSNKCGGCTLCNLSYDDTLEYKKNKVKNILKKFADIDIDVDIASCNKLNYRNKITLKIIDGNIGYYEEKSNDIVCINKCMIANDEINKFIKYINDFQIDNGEIVIRCNYNNELLINIITEDPIILPVIKDLKIVGILKNGNKLYGDDKFMEIINNMFFQVSYDSFFQINRDICSLIFDYIKEHIIPNSNVLDLYCGVGTLGINVANIVNKVYGIEIIPNAIKNAISNAKMNKVNNASYMLGDASKIIDKIKDDIDVLICDPPRSGLSNSIINVIKDKNIKQIIYVSCDPITLARDIKLLSDKYKIDKVKSYDMFPYTYHIESICILNLK